jgi:hypothetical protein
VPPYLSPWGAAGVVVAAGAVVLEVVGAAVAGALVVGAVVAEGADDEQDGINIKAMITSMILRYMAFDFVTLRMVETSIIKYISYHQ